jgi:predicted RNA methylase
VLDPCAGTGEPAAALARALGAESYGIELNGERAAQCRAHLDRLLATSAFSVRLTHGAFSCLWLNPPYDADDEKRRLEHAFLTGLSRALCPGGVLVFLIPQARLAVSARYLAAHYTGFRAYRFPEPEFAAFGQMVLLATKKPHAIPDSDAQTRLAKPGALPLYRRSPMSPTAHRSSCPRSHERRSCSRRSCSTRCWPRRRRADAGCGRRPPSPSSSGRPRSGRSGH